MQLRKLVQNVKMSNCVVTWVLTCGPHRQLEKLVFIDGQGDLVVWAETGKACGFCFGGSHRWMRCCDPQNRAMTPHDTVGRYATEAAKYIYV